MLLNILNIIEKFTQSKSLKELPDMILTALQEDDMKKMVYEIYKEYQDFMCITDMPKYKIYFKSKGKGCLLHSLDMAAEEYEQGTYNLYVSDVAYDSNIRKEVLYHEFTHIYDREFLYNKYRFGKEGKLADINTHPFTEIHAEQVRFLYMLGCKNINDNPKGINHNAVVWDINSRSLAFYDYLKDSKDRIDNVFVQGVDKIKHRHKKISKAIIGNMVDQLLYYIGALSIYIRYCNYKNDELMDLSNVNACWHVETDKVIDLYCNNDITTLQKIDIVKTSEIMMCDFVRCAESIGIL